MNVLHYRATGDLKMTRNIFTAGMLLIALSQSAQAADAARGTQRFQVMCGTCHAIDPSQRKIGPHLKGVVGRKAASVEGANYSPALKASGWTWDKSKLEVYLADPRKALPGTTMTIGVGNAQDRADIIAYLETLK
jgi:cytochrome c